MLIRVSSPLYLPLETEIQIAVINKPAPRDKTMKNQGNVHKHLLWIAVWLIKDVSACVLLLPNTVPLFSEQQKTIRFLYLLLAPAKQLYKEEVCYYLS